MAKIKVYIYVDEAYPVYYIDKEDGITENSVTIDDALYQKYVKAKKAWDEVQAELDAIYQI